MAGSATKTGGRREDPRLRVRFLAQLVTATRVHSVRLNDLSREGAGITADVPLELGSAGILRWQHLDDFGRVAWVDGARCGFMFQRPLTAAEVMLARSLARGFLVTPA